MTLEQLVSYLWNGVPLSGWGSILFLLIAVAGLSIYLNGKAIMRANSSCAKAISVTSTGEHVETSSSSVGPGYYYGVSVARSGLAMAFFATIGFVCLMQF